MESTEENKKYPTMAHSLSPEARKHPEFSEINEDSALQQMGALLTSNCEKLCMGPSFHLHTVENSQSLMDELKEVEPPADEISDKDEYETAICKGPTMPNEIMEDTILKENVQPNTKLDSLKLRLAQTSSEYGEFLSPDFLLQSFGNSSRTPDKNCTENDQSPNIPFSFPDVSHSARKKTEDGTELCDDHDTIQRLERIELVDDPSTDKGSEWIQWPENFIENEGFCLGIQPGNFFKKESRSRFYVELPHRCKYKVLVINKNQVPCDMDLYVDGQHTNSQRILAGVSKFIDGPRYSKLAFKFFRTEDPPPEKKVKKNTKNGRVKAVFVPRKIENARIRAASEPIMPMPSGTQSNDSLDLLYEDLTAAKQKRAFSVNNDSQNAVERSVDTSQFAEGATFLQENKEKRRYVKAPKMETDSSKKVVLKLRLIASLHEEIDATEEVVHNLQPPPLRRKI